MCVYLFGFGFDVILFLSKRIKHNMANEGRAFPFFFLQNPVSVKKMVCISVCAEKAEMCAEDDVVVCTVR